MKHMFFLIAVVILFFGCSGTVLSNKSTCLPNAIYTAVVLKQKTSYETRLVLLRSKKLGKEHVQTQVKVDDRWLWTDIDLVPRVIIDSGPDSGQRSSDDWQIVGYIMLKDAFYYVKRLE